MAASSSAAKAARRWRRRRFRRRARGAGADQRGRDAGVRRTHVSASWARAGRGRRRWRRVSRVRREPGGELLGHPVVARGAGIRGDRAGGVFGREQALRERAEGDDAHSGVLRGVGQAVLDPAVEHAVGGLVDEAGRAESGQDPGGLAGLLRLVGGDAGVEGLAGLDGGGERAHRLLIGVSGSGRWSRDVDVVESQRLRLWSRRRGGTCASEVAIEPGHMCSRPSSR